MTRTDLPLIAIVAVASLSVGVWLTVRVMRWRARLQGRARQAQGTRGEERAAQLLIQRGYRIVERQRRADYAITVDGAPTQVSVVMDFVVARDDQRFVAEVKTGAAAALNRDTRRQLLEYQLVSGHRVLLVDPDAAEITEVTFPFPAKVAAHASDTRALTWLMLGIASLVLYALTRSLMR